MKRSSERILTTHTGSLPRPTDLAALLQAKEAGELKDTGGLRRASQIGRGRGDSASGESGRRYRQ